MQTQFMGIIQNGDNYTVVDGVLNINKGRMATMAKFSRRLIGIKNALTRSY
ncbi:MAG: hypothetical protein AAF688_12230 [Bacteroidota bacterium]